jgi:purine-binding chemotaxis protein CheW
MSTISEDIKDQEEKERIENIDYKMVTFTLGGKDYGIDIMKVKEISKANRFTFVPNAAPYVRGVYNLRGDIISVIDFRIMFNLPAPKRQENELEDMIILRLNDYHIGIIVDSIDKVVGINSETIQPPHPIFGDINIQYISGVVENENRLYLILDAERILGQSEEAEEARQKQAALAPVKEGPEPAPAEEAAPESEEETEYPFVVENLQNLKQFFVTSRNRDYVRKRFEEWRRQRKGQKKEVQLQDASEADEFLATFYSPHTGEFWSDEYREKVKEVCGNLQTDGTVYVWNPGCGRGYETYSFTAVLRELYSQKEIKVWAHEQDLMSISTAPNLVFGEETVPEGLQQYTSEGREGHQFTRELRDLILFEYHNVLHTNPFPDVDIILARDIISFQGEAEQETLAAEIDEKLKPGGIVIIGTNEKLEMNDYEDVSVEGVRAYKKVTR